MLSIPGPLEGSFIQWLLHSCRRTFPWWVLKNSITSLIISGFKDLQGWYVESLVSNREADIAKSSTQHGEEYTYYTCKHGHPYRCRWTWICYYAWLNSFGWSGGWGIEKKRGEGYPHFMPKGYLVVFKSRITTTPTYRLLYSGDWAPSCSLSTLSLNLDILLYGVNIRYLGLYTGFSQLFVPNTRI